jgi:lysozyme
LDEFMPIDRAKIVRMAALPLLLAFAAACNATSEFDADLPKPVDYPIHGIDVSKFQGTVDWQAVASSGVKFAWK